MEDFIRTQLHPADICAICTEAFSAEHQPVALPACKHIFGHNCIEKWLRTGRGANTSCPSCRAVMYEKRDSNGSFDAPSLWKALCEQPPERLNTCMTHMWSDLQHLWKRKPSGKFSTTELLDKVIIPALDQTSAGGLPIVSAHDVFMDSYNFITGSWNSLGRPDRATGLAIPFVRLARLMSSASTTLPKWMTTVPRTNRLLWTANSSLGLTKCEISWDDIIAASQNVASTQHFPLLHLYTLLISQSIAHSAQSSVWPTRRYEVMNLVVERCCKKIGGDGWSGKPSNDFKDVLVLVYEELRKFQLKQKKLSLRGYGSEEEIVKAIWALAIWSVSKC
ncbi:hypothetical protein BDU57DRAFT_588818 [Ampelomyces quisqualis]|uniref:RING-type domain-containing protein n=1 Tax=Ampelomyces quisqualis TaxID=50730 RepID=A0A6A5QGA7_AMPQU|nr:hypothetical protein BDU57DRAFT_588818 [Ampelomyces quisqualis]